MKKKLIILFILCVGIIFVLRMSFKITGKCDEEIFIQNNNKDFIAKGIIKNCGSTTDYSTQILIQQENKVSEPVVILKGDKSKDCLLEWEENNLIINCKVNDSDVFLKKSNYKDVKILFNQI